MSDEISQLPSYDAEPPRQTPAGLFEHYCEHAGCIAWGGWGFPKDGNPKITTWRCTAHRIED